MSFIKKEDGSINLGRLIVLAVIVSIAFTILGNVIGGMFECKKSKYEDE